MFVSTPAWEPLLRRAMTEATPIDWTPVPKSGIALDERRRWTGRGTPKYFEMESDIVIGHFGTYREQFSPG